MKQIKFYQTFSIILILTMLVQVISLLRTTAMATNFGISNNMDAFNFANTAMVCLVNIMGPSVATVLIPFLAKMKDSMEDRNVLNTYITAVLAMTYVLLLAYFLIGSIYFYGSDGNNGMSFQQLTFVLTFILGVAQYTRLISAIQTAFLQMDSKFIIIKVVAILSAILSYIYIIVTPNLSIIEAAVCIGLSYVVECIGLIFSNRNKKYKYQVKFKWKNAEFRRLMRLTIPVTLSSVIYQVTVLLPNILARFFGEGYISTMVYANQIISIMQTLIIINLISMLYPTLTRSFNRSIEEAKKKLVLFINGSNMLVIPMIFGMIMLGGLVVKVLFERGNFTHESTVIVWQFLIFLSLALPFVVTREFIFKAFYAMGDTKTPVKNSLIVIITQIIFLSGGSFLIGVYAIMLSPLLAAILSTILGYRDLRKQIGPLSGNHEMIKQHALTTFNSLIMCAGIWGVMQVVHFNTIVNLLIYVGVGIVIYGVCVLLTQRKYIISLVNNR
ncbi:teichoic acid/polysaccharide export protein [Listeria weihenstephanensis]|uniref:Teichoic acid/polysaccharide export protein n=1 Tax=Listeria weihenstephanensis TaxID=1006155 RepID=A0A841ZAR7_9LIST|nr:lipid II flippase MurJ [Listeria weihenstephanensis]MBC1501702.1 teichoic acid/polysaccharide export protein [Listeria weihenstephanensis]